MSERAHGSGNDCITNGRMKHFPVDKRNLYLVIMQGDSVMKLLGALGDVNRRTLTRLLKAVQNESRAAASRL
jgi:hypothetical protein